MHFLNAFSPVKNLKNCRLSEDELNFVLCEKTLSLHADVCIFTFTLKQTVNITEEGITKLKKLVVVLQLKAKCT